MNSFYTTTTLPSGHLVVQDHEQLKELNKLIQSGSPQSFSILHSGVGRYRASLSQLNSKEAHFIPQQCLSNHDAHITLYLGLGRPQTMKKILEQGSALGVKYFKIFNSERMIASYRQSELWQKNKYQSSLIKGLRQADYYHQLPKVEFIKFDTIRGGDTPSFFGDPLTDQVIPSIKSDEVSLLIGPEAGLTEDEKKMLQSQGLSPFKLAPSTLRMETAACLALGHFQNLT